MAGEFTVGKNRAAVMGVGNDLDLARGMVTMSAATLNVDTGLSAVTAAVVTLEDDPVTSAGGARLVSCEISPTVPGRITIKLWQLDGTAATAFGTGGMDVNWTAVG